MGSVPSSWLTAISRGGLYVPWPWWMAVVDEFEGEFMGSTFSREPGIVQRLSQGISHRHPGLHRLVANRLARVRTYMRVTQLRQELTNRRADRRAKKQLYQHASSQC